MHTGKYACADYPLRKSASDDASVAISTRCAQILVSINYSMLKKRRMVEEGVGKHGSRGNG